MEGRFRKHLEEYSPLVRDFCPAVMFSKEFLVNFVNSGTLNILSQNDRGFVVQESLNFHNKTLNISLFHRNVNM